MLHLFVHHPVPMGRTWSEDFYLMCVTSVPCISFFQVKSRKENPQKLTQLNSSDSLSVLRSLKNLDHRNPLLQQICRKYNYLSSFKEVVFCWLPSHTNIRGNELADLEAKSALSLSITNLKIPHSDFKSNIHQYVMNKCQSVWEEQTGNKLHELKPDFNSKCSFLGYSRQIQTKITRCRIGHTRLTLLLTHQRTASLLYIL